MLEEKLRQVLRGGMGMGTKEDESSAGHVLDWAHSETYEPYFLSCSNFFSGHSKLWIEGHNCTTKYLPYCSTYMKAAQKVLQQFPIFQSKSTGSMCRFTVVTAQKVL
jgi:hypothetical protein